jgi:hypothetical protein
LFELQKKDIHIVEKKGSFERFLIVKCIESFIGGIGGRKNMIRTLRIINPDDNFELLDEIILEQIPAYTYNPQLQRNHTSILQNGHTIFFFRREKSRVNKG